MICEKLKKTIENYFEIYNFEFTGEVGYDFEDRFLIYRGVNSEGRFDEIGFSRSQDSIQVWKVLRYFDGDPYYTDGIYGRIDIIPDGDIVWVQLINKGYLKLEGDIKEFIDLDKEFVIAALEEGES